MPRPDLFDLGLTGVALIVILMLVDVIRRRYRESEKGDRRTTPKTNGLSTTLEGMLSNLAASTRMLTELLRIMEETKGEIRNVANVANLHASGSRSEKIREESRDLLRELILVIKRNGSRK